MTAARHGGPRGAHEALARLRGQRPAMLTDLQRLVTVESPSGDPAALHRCADVLTQIGTPLLGAPPARSEADGGPVLWFGPPNARVLLLGHLDTVHPLGTLDRVPCQVTAGWARGPGVLDMKAGLVQGLYALAGAAHPEQAALLVTADEELGSPGGRPVIEQAARAAQAVLVLEPGAGSKLKTARKGVSRYELELTGRAAHAGLDPTSGANACLGLAHVALRAAELADEAAGTTVTPTLAAAGTSANTVPESARLTVDVRAVTAAEQQRADRALRAPAEPLPGVSLTVRGGINRPPMPESAAADLFARSREVSVACGLGDLEGCSVGGGSDGNFTAALGAPTLDGLGGIGTGVHTEEECLEVAALPDRTALLAALINSLTVEGTCR